MEFKLVSDQIMSSFDLEKNCTFVSLSKRPSADLKKPHTISKLFFVSGSYESLELLKDLIRNGFFRWYIFMFIKRQFAVVFSNF